MQIQGEGRPPGRSVGAGAADQLQVQAGEGWLGRHGRLPAQQAIGEGGNLPLPQGGLLGGVGAGTAGLGPVLQGQGEQARVAGHHLGHQPVGGGGQAILQPALAEGGGIAEPGLVQGALAGQAGEQQHKGGSDRQGQGETGGGAGPAENHGGSGREPAEGSRQRTNGPLARGRGLRGKMALQDCKNLICRAMRLNSDPEPRAPVHPFVERHQLNYSLLQLRLVGILLLLVLAARAVGLFLSLEGPSIQQLSALTSLSNSLPLLPLGISLYLLGGGRQRQPREFLPTEVLHRFLVPLALACLVVLPFITLTNVQQLRQNMSRAESEDQVMVSRHEQWLGEADRATTPAALQALVKSYGLELPVSVNEPVGLSRWRLARTLELELTKARKASPLLSLSPYQRELLSLPRSGSTVLMQLITGVGLLLLHRQGSREIRKHGLSVALFFRADPDMPRRRWAIP